MIKRRAVPVLGVALILLLVLTAPVRAEYSPASAESAANRMKLLELVKGRTGGDLQLGATITRAELITIIVRAFGQEDVAKMLAGAPTGFGDVPPNHWASGYVTLAKNLIEQNGHKLGVNAEGTQFNPNGNVTAAEAVAFLMKFLGVSSDSSLAWPNNFLMPAVEAGLISQDDLPLMASMGNLPVDRGLVFYLSDNAFASYKTPNGKTVYQTYVDSQAPAITIDQYPAEVAEATVTITGSVSADTVELFSPQGPIPVVDGKFAAPLTLKEGPNSIPLSARDLAGNAGTATVSILRKPAAVAQQVTATLSMEQVPVSHAALLTVTVTENGQAVAGAPYTVTVGGALAGYDPQSRQVTAGKSPGTGIITVQTPHGASVTLEVPVYNGLALIEVTPNVIEAKLGEEIQFSARGLDFNGDEVALGAVTWSVLLNLAEITADGMLSIPEVKGLLVVKAEADGKVGTANLFVNPGEIEIQAKMAFQLKPGQQVPVEILVTQDGEPLNLPPRVTSDLGTYDSASGIFTAGSAPGKGHITFELAGYSFVYELVVLEP